MSFDFFDERRFFGIPIVAVKPDIESLFNIRSVKGRLHCHLVHPDGRARQAVPTRVRRRTRPGLESTALPTPPWKQGKMTSKGLPDF